MVLVRSTETARMNDDLLLDGTVYVCMNGGYPDVHCVGGRPGGCVHAAITGST